MTARVSGRGVLLTATSVLVVLMALGAYLIGVPGWIVTVGAVVILGLLWRRALRRARRDERQREAKT